MTPMFYLAAAVFLPLFPFGMLATAVFERVTGGWGRAALLILWPQIGLAALATAAAAPGGGGEWATGAVPDWVVVWAMLSALFYAWRALALREAGQWIAFMAVSSWALLWAGAGIGAAHPVALGLSLPLAVFALLVGRVERHFGGAHVALDLRLGSRAPRLAGLVATGALAAAALPLSPSFFVLVGLVTVQAGASLPTVLALLGVWLLWTWSAARLLSGLVSGPTPAHVSVQDIPAAAAWTYTALFALLAAAGIALGGTLL